MMGTTEPDCAVMCNSINTRTYTHDPELDKGERHPYYRKTPASGAREVDEQYTAPRADNLRPQTSNPGPRSWSVSTVFWPGYTGAEVGDAPSGPLRRLRRGLSGKEQSNYLHHEEETIYCTVDIETALFGMRWRCCMTEVYFIIPCTGQNISRIIACVSSNRVCCVDIFVLEMDVDSGEGPSTRNVDPPSPHHHPHPLPCAQLV